MTTTERVSISKLKRVAHKSFPSSSALPQPCINTAVVVHTETQFGYARKCPGENGCSDCLGLIRMPLNATADSWNDGGGGSCYSLECCCKCHNIRGGARNASLGFETMVQLSERADIAAFNKEKSFSIERTTYQLAQGSGNHSSRHNNGLVGRST
jgi:hypothetical protein